MSHRFFVHVVESPSPLDFLGGNLEGRVLYQALCTSRVDADYAIAVDHATFFGAIGARLLERIRADGYKRWPILHIAAHGSKEGVALTSRDDFVPWLSLGNYLRSLNTLLKGALIVCMSSCHGAFARIEALREPANPFYALVAPASTISLGDLAIGFSSFYHVLSKTWDIEAAHAAMRIAAGNDTFELIYPETERKQFRQWQIRQLIDAALKQYAEQGGAPSPPPPPEHSDESAKPQ